MIWQAAAVRFLKQGATVKDAPVQVAFCYSRLSWRLPSKKRLGTSKAPVLNECILYGFEALPR